MRNFNQVYKEKVNESEQLHESKIVGDFRKIYNALLEHYNLTAIHDLNEKSQLSFLTELNQYWSEETGLNEEGLAFLEKRSLRLTENSTPLQKKNFLKSKTTVLLNETLRQNDVKFKVYSIIDEMYQQVKGESIEDVLTPNMISDILTEAMAESLDDIITTIRYELNESVKPKKKLNENVKPKVFLKKKLNEAQVEIATDIVTVNQNQLGEILKKYLNSESNHPMLIIANSKKMPILSHAIGDRINLFQLPGSGVGDDISDLTNEVFNHIMESKKKTVILSTPEAYSSKFSTAMGERFYKYKLD